MSMVTSCTLLSGGQAVRPAISSGGQLQYGRPGAVAVLSSGRRSRTLSVCCADNPKGEHNPNKDLRPFNISPVVLVNPVQPRTSMTVIKNPKTGKLRFVHEPAPSWQLEEDATKVDLWFEVPGQSKEDLAVEIDEDVLVIKKKTTGDQQNGGGGPRRENNKAASGGAGSGQDANMVKGMATVNSDVMYARLLLPAGYGKEGVKAELKSGELKVTIAKVKEQARRRISVSIDAK